MRVSWDTLALLSNRVISELLFWLDLLPDHTGPPIRQREIVPSVVVTLDTSYRAWLGWMDFGSGERLLARDVLSEVARLFSSTARELVGVLGSLVSFAAFIGAALGHEGGDLVVYCDNQSAVRALGIGSKTPEVQAVAAAVFRFATSRGWSLVPRWLPRDSLAVVMTDEGSKLDKVMDLADFKLDPEVFRAIERLWQVHHTHNRFASAKNV
jgi:hypothetical protein